MRRASWLLALFALMALPASAQVTCIGGGCASSGSTSITSGTTVITGGGNKQICFNDAGAAACGDSGVTLDKATHTVTATTFVGAVTGTASGNLVSGGALGTPSSGTLTNATGLPIAGIAGLGTGIATWWATPSSANLAAALTDETGSGAAVFATSPVLVMPTLGAFAATSGVFGGGSLGSGHTITLPQGGIIGNAGGANAKITIGDSGGLLLNYASNQIALGASSITIAATGSHGSLVSDATGPSLVTPDGIAIYGINNGANTGARLSVAAPFEIRTSSASALALGTNGTDRVTLGATGTVTLATDESVSISDAGTNTALTMLTLDHASSGTPAASFGDKVVFNGSSATVASRNMANIYSQWRTATDASRDAKLVFDVWGSAAGANVGWAMFNTTPCCNNMAAFAPSADLTTYMGMEAGQWNYVSLGTYVGNWSSSLLSVLLGNIKITANALTAATMTAETTAQVRTTTHSYTWTNAQVAALPTTAGDIKMATLPAKTVVENAYVIITGAAAGPTTVTVACGRTGATYIDYITAQDAKAAANTVYGDASAERGTNLAGNYDLPSYTGTTDINCHFISTGANLSTVTGSTGRVILTTSLVP